MLPRKRRKFNPPHRIWVVLDLDTGNPVSVYRDPPEDVEEAVYENEVIYEYVFQKVKK